MDSIKYRDPELEESFSFSSYNDFNSYMAAVFSDNDETDDDDDSYIEIAIEPTITHQRNDDHDDDGDDQSYNEEMELRISFSSIFPISEPSTKTKITMDMEPSTLGSSSSSSASSTFTFSSSASTDTTSQWDSQAACKPSTSRIKNTIERKIRFPFLNTLIPSLRVSSEMDRESGQAAAGGNHLEVVPSSTTRNASKLSATNSGNMMKFLIKFRALKVRAMLASFMKTCQVNSSLDKSNGCKRKSREETLRTTIKPFDKLLVQSNQGRSSSNNNKNPNNLYRNGVRSRVYDMNLDAIKGVLEAMSMSFGRNNRKTKSCPSSTKSSPIHQRFPTENYQMSATDNSIQAAIAHCKGSFGQNDICL